LKATLKKKTIPNFYQSFASPAKHPKMSCSVACGSVSTSLSMMHTQYYMGTSNDLQLEINYGLRGLSSNTGGARATGS
jgi:hypothetical protein